MDDAVVPVVDLDEGDAACVRLVRTACETTGFFFLKGHGVPQRLVEHVFQGGRTFFHQPSSAKDKWKTTSRSQPFGYASALDDGIRLDPNGQRLPDQREQLKLGRQRYGRDFKEWIARKASIDAEAAKPSSSCSNGLVWLCEEATDERWRNAVNRYFELVSGIAQQLLRIVALSLELEGDYFDAYFAQPSELMNINYYHATRSVVEDGKLGCGAHTDYGMLTLLMTDAVPGLQIKGRATAEEEDVWIDVNPREGHFIVNVGDLMERWSNGKYAANLHRVVNASGRERMSVAFFFEPHLSAVVSPVPSCCLQGKPKYDDVVFSEWLASKYHDTGELDSS